MEQPLDTTSFREALIGLKRQWEENREAERLWSSHDRESQYGAMRLVHAWCADAVNEILDVYGPSIDVHLPDLPPLDTDAPAFTVRIGPGRALTVALTRSGRREDHFRVMVGTRSQNDAHWIAAAPGRNEAHWTRAKIEALLLSLLAAHERAQRRETSGPRSIAPRRTTPPPLPLSTPTRRNQVIA